MNERIRQCADGAGLDSNWKPGFDSIYGQQLEKFAELIVRECVNVCESMQLIGPYKEVQNATLKDAAIQIKEHFGVE
jgi:hypothetical protein